MAEFILGFKALADMIPEVVGTPSETEHWQSNGDSLQGTSRGLMVYRKLLNSAAFTDGAHTWVWGPNGLQDRDNADRFDWEERPPEYKPSVLLMPTKSETFLFGRTPKGFALHGTRSGRQQPMLMEFQAGASWEVTRRDGLSANCTIGEDVVAQHVPLTRWGWHAFNASRYYVSLECAQGTVQDAITDGQVRAVCWVVQQAREVWPAIPLRMRSHAELEHDGETGPVSGKTDPFPMNDERMDELRSRIYTRLDELGVR